ncbi:hypothetical protein CALCODRAFT_363398 [Calocera cornea HHB12733]|uniref:Uncharacterized protein n=1 Tax=Calocera cornea HHB12733 TaxID=1353952 RepID=A0A165EKK1_9BASI|nr:hypothetical protein CALCODRAFT_363398 [Calocera cornea HHB12733]
MTATPLLPYALDFDLRFIWIANVFMQLCSIIQTATQRRIRGMHERTLSCRSPTS